MWMLINKIIPTRVAIGFLVSLVTVSFVYWEYASARALESWNKGLFDEMAYEMEMCNIKLEGVPWASILPNKFFNFFTGSDECPDIESFSYVEPDGMLNLNCTEPTALVIENPDYLFNHTDLFVLEETGITEY